MSEGDFAYELDIKKSDITNDENSMSLHIIVMSCSVIDVQRRKRFHAPAALSVLG